jgi:hypothetical protein
VVDTSDGYAVNFNTSSVSGTETTGKTITITVTDYAFPGEVTSFQSIHGYSVMVGSSSLYKAHSTVDGTSDSSTTAPIGGGGGLGALTTVHTPTDPSEIVFTATLQSFKPFHGITPSISGGTLLTVVPEPNAMLIGLLGVPCMGAVVYLARRRSAALAGMVA